MEVIRFNLWRSFHNEYALLDVVYFTRSIKSNHYGVKVIKFNLWHSFHNGIEDKQSGTEGVLFILQEVTLPMAYYGQLFYTPHLLFYLIILYSD